MPATTTTTTTIAAQRARRDGRLALLLAGVLLLLGVRPPAAWSVTAPSIASGTYDVWQRGPSDEPLLAPTGRIVVLRVYRQTVHASTYRDGHLTVSRVLIPAGPVTYERAIGRWYQDFETAPNNPKTTHERIRLTFRNDGFGSYDIAYRRRDNTWASEVLVRRPSAG